jgi:hypothetical protein
VKQSGGGTLWYTNSELSNYVRNYVRSRMRRMNLVFIGMQGSMAEQHTVGCVEGRKILN